MLEIILNDFLDKSSGIFEYDGLLFKLVEASPSDRALVEAAYSDFRTRNTAVPITEFTPQGIDIKLNKFIAAARSGLGIMTVTDQRTGVTLGLAGLTWMDAEQTKVEVNRVLLREHQNNGYGTRILNALMSLAFDKLQLDSLYSENLSFNTAAQKSLENAGFVPVIERLDLSATIHGIGNYKDTRCTKYQITREFYLSQTPIQHQRVVRHPEARSREAVQQEARDIIRAHAEKETPNLEEREASKTAIIRLCAQLELNKLERLEGHAKKSRLQKLNHLPEGHRSIYQTKLVMFVNTAVAKYRLAEETAPSIKESNSPVI